MIQRLITQDSISARAILTTERRHQYTVLANGRVNIIWIVAAIALMLPAIAAAVGLFTAAIIVSINPALIVRTVEIGYGMAPVRNLILMMVGMALATDFVVSLVALALAANAITREYEGNTWQLVLLTGVSARHLVLGKWWASVLVLRRDFISVAILRVGLVSLLYLYPPIILHLGLLAQVGIFMLAILLTLVYTVLDAQLIAALAVLGTLFTEQANRGFSLGLRLVVLLVGALTIGFAALVMQRIGFAWAFVLVPTVLVTVWVGMLVIALWLSLWVGVQSRILPIHP